ncbi:N4-gp56 family major capsid protein [Lacticaseibacillus absianus]|uniref:N4-gp56 family major capsid protein n=1 Tax=Lacticaseibacillus absianus TaxID=2729623 RepID=UPI0015CA21B2|nr:N4-gp56 family major capsid protein [Lacticaseibacillus absianus]
MPDINPTTASQMIDPEVMGAIISAELPKRLAFRQLAPVDETLEGRPGDTVTVPRFNYTGDAKDVAEGEAIQYDQLTTGTTQLTIKKAAKGLSFTDESTLIGYGDPVGEGRKQITNGIAAKMDYDALNAALDARLKIAEPATLDVSLIDAIENTFDDDNSPYKVEDQASASAGVLFMNPKDMRTLRAAIMKTESGDWTRQTDLGDSVLVSGSIGRVLGWEIQTSKKLPVGTQLAIKPGALRTYMKRGVNAESGRDMDRKLTKFNADAIYGVAIYDDTKILVIGDNSEVAGDGAQDPAVKPTSPRGSKRVKSTKDTTNLSTKVEPDAGK